MWSLAALHWIGFRLDSGLVLLTRCHSPRATRPRAAANAVYCFTSSFQIIFQLFLFFGSLLVAIYHTILYLCVLGPGQGRTGQGRPGQAGKQASSARRLRASLCAAKVFCAQQRLRGDQTESAKQTGGSTIVPGFALSSPASFRPPHPPRVLRHASVKSTESLANFSIGLTNIKKFTTSHRKWVAAGRTGRQPNRKEGRMTTPESKQSNSQ